MKFPLIFKVSIFVFPSNIPVTSWQEKVPDCWLMVSVLVPFIWENITWETDEKVLAKLTVTVSGVDSQPFAIYCACLFWFHLGAKTPSLLYEPQG